MSRRAIVTWFVSGALVIGVLAFVFFRSTAVAVALPDPGAAQAAACRNLATLLPGSLDARPRRATTPNSELTAAWGDPPVVLRCGVGRPQALQLTSQLFQANGVSWFAEPADSGWRFTATGRAAYVEVTVSSGTQAQASAPLVDLAAAVSNGLPERADGAP